ncbi:MAG: HD domain-containing protein [Spirochaetia bacterium]|jgi:dGTPase|nr:HD domain-containing protein [Spirochaetia bacterium]
MVENKISSEKLTERLYPRVEDERGFYFRDITAIIHSYPFRRLKHKTQVFFSPKNDHICTRIEHVMHVATISVTICKALSLESDLAWAISLAHDLGHTPFGHTGEHIISSLLAERGGFKHEGYSLRVVDHLINYGKGLNLTYAVRDGIINHCGEVFEQSYRPDFTVKDLSSLEGRSAYPSTWEGVAVRASDRIAYLGRDLEDALQLKILEKNQIPAVVTKTLGSSNSDMIDTLVKDVIRYAEKNGEIGFSDPVYDAMIVLKDFNYKNIYNSSVLEDFHKFIERVLKTLWEYLSSIFYKYGYEYEKYKAEKTMLASRFSDFLSKMEDFYKNIEKTDKNVVLDYIAGMTDAYALDCISELYLPGKFFYNFYS